MKPKIRRLLTATFGLVLPRRLKPSFLNMLGHKVSSDVKIGFSLLLVDRIYLAAESRIGNLNFISCRRLVLRQRAYLQTMNIIRGPISVWMAKTAGIGTRNLITRARKPISQGPSVLKLGVLSKVTSTHTLDCMRSIHFGNYTTVAGKGSQFWTHGYYHYPDGPDRFRIDGRILIGNNVYVGSACVFSMGLRIGDGIVIGSHSSVSKSIDEPGLYVSQPLRRVAIQPEKMTESLKHIDPSVVCENVYEKLIEW